MYSFPHSFTLYWWHTVLSCTELSTKNTKKNKTCPCPSEAFNAAEESSRSTDSATNLLCRDSYDSTKEEAVNFAWGCQRRPFRSRLWWRNSHLLIKGPRKWYFRKQRQYLLLTGLCGLIVSLARQGRVGRNAQETNRVRPDKMGQELYVMPKSSKRKLWGREEGGWQKRETDYPGSLRGLHRKLGWGWLWDEMTSNGVNEGAKEEGGIKILLYLV